MDAGCGRIVGLFTFMVIFSLALPGASFSGSVNLESGTLVRYFERENRSGADSQVVPIYEYLRLDLSRDRDDPLSFHLYGWGRATEGDEFFEDDTAGELLYGYLQYRPPAQNLLLRLGRQYVFEGVANESVDGLFARIDLTSSVSVSGYAGMPAALDSSAGRDGDLLYGGRVAWSRRGLFEIGTSYKFIANDSDTDEKRIGVDLSLQLPKDIFVSGYSTRNLITGGWAEHSYEARLYWGSLEVRPFFQSFNYDDFFSDRDNSAAPFRFLAGTGNSLTSTGGEVFWYPDERIECGVKVKYYNYQERFDSSQYYAGFLTWKWSILSQAGLEIGRMDGDGTENRYTLGRAFFYWDAAPGFLTGDVVYVPYDEQIYAEDRSLFASVGVGKKFLRDSLALKLSIDYSSDPYFEEDVRGLFRVDFTYDN